MNENENEGEMRSFEAQPLPGWQEGRQAGWEEMKKLWGGNEKPL